MAQYYQVTSLDELQRLYPNIQLDNVEGIQCMIQDDLVAQYPDGQGQQIIARVEQSGQQVLQNPTVSQQCPSQPSQFLVRQPAQYVIQHMKTTESQAPSIRYIQGRSITHTDEENSEVQFKEQKIECVTSGEGNNEHSIQQTIAKQENNPTTLTQVQPVLHQSVQIHQQGENILVLQNQRQNLLVSPNKGQELVTNQNQQESQQHVIIQRHQHQKPQQIISQGQPEENSAQQFIQQQLVQTRRHSHSGGQEQQIIHHSQHQQIIHCYNPVTVLDGFTQSNANIEHCAPSNEELSQQQQITHQGQKFKQEERMHQIGTPTIIQQSEVLVPQKFEMSSSPLGSRMLQHRKKMLQQEVETSTTPVFIVQKLDNPFLIRQPQTKIRLQSAQLKDDKISNKSVQSTGIQIENNIENSPQENPQIAQSRGKQLKMNTSGLQTSTSNFSIEESQPCGQYKVGIIEQGYVNRITDQVNKQRIVPSTILTKSIVSRNKTCEPQNAGDSREIHPQQYERYIGNMQPQSQSPSMPQTQQLQSSPQTPMQHSPIQNQIQICGRGAGRGLKGGHMTPISKGGHQYVPRARGVQVQTSPPRLPKAEGGGNIRKLKSPRGGSRGGRGEWVPCGLDQRPGQIIQHGTTQVVQTVPADGDTNQNPNESMEEARMLVLVLNDEKKMIKIPCSQQNIHLGQILQQAGLSLTSPTSVSIEQVVDISNSDQFIIKNNAVNSQQLTAIHRPLISQSGAIPISSASPRSIVATFQQRSRGHAPRLIHPQSIGIIRHRLQFTGHRVSSSSGSQTNISSNPTLETNLTQSQTIQTAKITQPPQKEEPRFVTGYMAICPFCGISSLDFNKCIRCRRKLPENVKSQSIFNAKKKKPEKNGADSEKNCENNKGGTEGKQSDSTSSEEKEKSFVQGFDKKKTKSYVKKKKINDEPAEILILSSDEEEESKSKRTETVQQSLTVLRKEPVYMVTNISEGEMDSWMKENSLNEDLMKNVQPGSFTTLQCRTIRVGSYKVHPKERVLLSSKGIRLVINSLKNENTTIVIPITSILKTLIHFGKQIPVIFLYPLPKVGFQIRSMLGMDSEMGPYYDPTSVQETHKRITLLLEKLTEDNKITLHKIFGQGILEELSEKEANEILIRASPVELPGTSLNRPTDNVRKIMVYPPPPEKGGITLNNQDYACLGEDQFLNDVIIDFYLKYLMLKVLSPEDRSRTHVFSTFFYKRLTTKPKTMRKNDPENDPKLTPAEKRHLRVKGWTKQVNLFEKDFVIVPINEHSHWFLAIICFPGLSGPVRFSDNTPVQPEEVASKKNAQTVQIGNTTITHIVKSEGNAVSLEMDFSSDRDEAEGDQDDLHPSSDDEESEQAEEESSSSPTAVQIPLLAPLPESQGAIKDPKVKPVKRKPFKDPIKQPCILIFDSLAGASRVRVVATLRDYLKIEYKKKMGHERDFSKDTIKGAVPKVPQQNNFTDCGLYVLQYVESFFQDPLHDFKLPLKYLQDWFPEEVVSCKRQQLACLIRTLMEEQGIKVEEIGLPVLTFANGNNVADGQSRLEEEEDDEDEDELNEEDGLLMQKRVQISEFNNDYDEDMDLGEEEEEDEEEEEEEDDELVEDEEDNEELEEGEIQRRWITKPKICNDLDPSVEHIAGHISMKTGCLVNYDSSGSEEDCPGFSHMPEIVGQDETSIYAKEADDVENSETDQNVISDNRKSVPLTDIQDFESQIQSTTIEKNFEGKNIESDMLISDEEDECGGNVDEEDTSVETSAIENTVPVTPGYNQTVQSVDKRQLQSSDTLVKDNKTLEVTNIIKKLVNDKNITISRKDDELKTNPFKKVDVKRCREKECDKSEEIKKDTNSCLTPKNNISSCKRSYQALKSFRIPRKAERKVETTKRQKVDET